MAEWVIPPAEVITGQTKIKDADNKFMNMVTDLSEWANSTGSWVGQGLRTEMEDRVDTYLSDTSIVEW